MAYDERADWSTEFSPVEDAQKPSPENYVAADPVQNFIDDDVKPAFDLCFLRDGRATATGNFRMGNYKLTGLGDATNPQDAITKNQVEEKIQRVDQDISDINDEIENIYDEITNAPSRSLGEIFISMRKDIPPGARLCDGEIESVDNDHLKGFTDLFLSGKLPYISFAEFETEVNTNGVCGICAFDSVEKNVRFPLLKDVYLKSTENIDEVGKYQIPTLPNIKGNYSGGGPRDGGLELCTGPFERTGTGATSKTTGAQAWYYGDFDASRVSSIYKDDATVNTSSVKYRFFIQVSTGVIEASQEVQSEILNTLSEKANIALSNVNANAKETSIGWGMPDYSKKFEITSFPFTAPTKGYIYLEVYAPETSVCIYVNNNIVRKHYPLSPGGAGELYFGNLILLDINDILHISGGIANGTQYFYPLKGAQ